MMPDHVSAPIRYTVNNGVKPVSLSRTLGGRIEYLNCDFTDHTVKIHNGRNKTGEFVFDRHGFVFVDHVTRVTDFYDRDEVEKVYYPEAGALLRQVTGSGRVHIFDHTVRSGDAAMQEAGLREPLKQVHNDYTDRSGPQRVRDLLPEEAEELLRYRFMIVQVWRPIGTAIVSEPLRCVMPRALQRQTLSRLNAGIRTAWVKPIPLPTTPTIAGTTSRRCGATRPSFSRSTIQQPTATRVLPPMVHSMTPVPRKMHRPGKVLN